MSFITSMIRGAQCGAALLLVASSYAFAEPPAPPVMVPMAGVTHGPPVYPTQPVTETLFGRKVTDPYRWMENMKSKKFQDFMRDQAAYTTEVLAAIPGRNELFKRIAAVDSESTSVGGVVVAGRRYFYLESTPESQIPRLFVRDGLRAPERLLFDPATMAHDGIHFAIDFFQPSPNGKYCVIGASQGGSEDSVLHIIDADNAKLLPETIDRAEQASPSWLEDNKSFFYNRMKKLTPADSGTEKYRDSAIYLHTIQTDANADRFIFGRSRRSSADAYTNPSVAPEMIADDVASINIPIASPKLAILVINRGVQNEGEVFVAPVSEVVLKGSKAAWHRAASFDDQVVPVANGNGADAHGADIFLLSHKNASRYQILRVNALHPEAPAQVFVPKSDGVVRDFVCASDALYVHDIVRGLGRVRRVSYTGAATTLSVPYKGSVGGLVPGVKGVGVLFESQNWITQRHWFEFNPAGQGLGALTDTGLQPAPSTDVSALAVDELSYAARDGVQVPISIIHRSDSKLDGSHPTIIEAYGAYGITFDPRFSVALLPWVERGGIFAVAHVRGGGEFGEDWHRAGMKRTKANTWRDLIDGGEWLVKQGYTSRGHLACRGGSAGGITVGRAITERPDLFAVALDDVPAANPTRSEFSPNGPGNIPEFGTVANKDESGWLYEMDSYLHIKGGTPYPAVMITTGINDPRVDSWEPAKMAAGLQTATTSRKPVLLRVDFDAGHGIGSTRLQRDQEEADEESFALWQMGDPEFQPGH